MTKAELEARVELGIVPQSQDVFGKRAAKFDDLVEQRVSLKELQKQTEAELKELDEKIVAYLADTDIKTVISGGAKVTQCQNPGQTKLSRELLLEKGVPAITIAECTLPGKPYSYVLVTAVKTAT